MWWKLYCWNPSQNLTKLEIVDRAILFMLIRCLRRPITGLQYRIFGGSRLLRGSGSGTALEREAITIKMGEGNNASHRWGYKFLIFNRDCDKIWNYSRFTVIGILIHSCKLYISWLCAFSGEPFRQRFFEINWYIVSMIIGSVSVRLFLLVYIRLP